MCNNVRTIVSRFTVIGSDFRALIKFSLPINISFNKSSCAMTDDVNRSPMSCAADRCCDIISAGSWFDLLMLLLPFMRVAKSLISADVNPVNSTSNASLSSRCNNWFKYWSD